MATDRELPDDASLQDLKDSARRLQTAARAGEPHSRRRVGSYFDDPSGLKLRQAQLVIAREYGFASWRKLESFVRVRDARTEALARLRDATRRMAPTRELMREYEAANREAVRLTRRWMSLLPDRGSWPPLETLPADDAADDAAGTLRCSFCRKPHHQVHKLIAGPGVFICNECVDMCLQILWEDLGEQQ